MSEKGTAKEKLAKALAELMKEKPFDLISVTEISERAGVSRMAYYRNTQTKEELLLFLVERFASEFVYRHRELIRISLVKYFEALFRECFLNKEFLSLLDGAGYVYMFKEVIDRYFFEIYRSAEGQRETQGYESCYFSGALYNVFLLWEKNGMKESPGEMAELYCGISENGWRINRKENIEGSKNV